MLLSLALIILLGLSLNAIFVKVKIPSLIAYTITGIILGPYVLDLLEPSLLNISDDLRRIALIVILVRAGLTLDIRDLKIVGKGAILLSFLPATIEIIVVTIISYFLFSFSIIEGLILGSVLAAVSPAVVVPRMIELIEKKRGTKKSIPQMVLAASSIDDIYSLVLFTVFIQFYQSNSVEIKELLLFPISIILGVVSGFIIAYLLVKIFKRFHMRDTIKVLIIFGFAFMLDYIEKVLVDIIPFSSLIGVLTIGLVILKFYPLLAERLNNKFSRIWVFSEMMLFVLIGALVNITVIGNISYKFLLMLLGIIVFRFISVFISTIGLNMNVKERIFVFISYLPKATVQAAIGSIPLSMGVSGGEIILAVSVLAIIVTAPLGAILIDITSVKLLKENKV
jgi:NhaP-type Na+/H+ or K+/H+ antiporter